MKVLDPLFFEQYPKIKVSQYKKKHSSSWVLCRRETGCSRCHARHGIDIRNMKEIHLCCFKLTCSCAAGSILEHLNTWGSTNCDNINFVAWEFKKYFPETSNWFYLQLFLKNLRKKLQETFFASYDGWK